MTQTNGSTGVTSPLELSTLEIICMCSLLCATDVIAAISLIKPEKQPKLFSLVFGEGITNDAVSIILFNAVINYSRKAEKFSGSAVLEISVDFFLLFFRSLLCGFIVAVLSSLLLKKCRALTKSPVVECAMIFSFAYVAYVVAELWHFSGIITLLTCSVMMANYTWYNLSPQGKQSSVVIFKFLGFLAECFVFSYLGLTFFSYQSYNWSTELIVCELLVIIIGRGMGTFGLFSFLKLFGYEKDNPKKITWRELGFIWYAGLIRGAIAFGLVLRIDKTMANRGVIVTTCLTLVVFTTIFFGSTVGLLGKCLFKESEAEEEAKEKANNQVGVEEVDSVGTDTMSNTSSDKSSQINQPLIHYNEQMETEEKNSAQSAAKKKKN